MKKILMLTFVVFLVGCSSKEKMDYFIETESTDLSALQVNHIHLNSSSSDILKNFGSPDYIEKNENPAEKHYIYGFKEDKRDLEIRISNEKVTRFLLSTNEYELNSETMINQLKDKIVSSYGLNYYLREDTGSKILGYVDKDNNYNLEFYLDDEDLATHITLEIYEES